jgi:preprotein translocase subunit SecG
MQLAAIDWLSISINLLLVVFVVICILMTLLILMQRPKQEGLGAAFGGGVTDQVFGARTTNVLQRGTVYLGSLFFLISLALAVLIGQQNRKTSLVSPEQKAAVAEEAATPAVEEPALPKSLSEELPVAPSTPANEAADQSATGESTPAVDAATNQESAPADAGSAAPTDQESAPADAAAGAEGPEESPQQP